MRIPSILLALLFGLTSLVAAPATDQSQPTTTPAAPSVKSGLLNGAVAAMPIGKFRPANKRGHDVSRVGIFDRRNLGSIHIEEDRDNVCYTMRSYVVARDNRDSDSTNLVGYSTCQPASKYELRVTVEDAKE
jgi:hypothetical protein